MIDQIAWAVPPGGKTNTRPVLLTRELVKLGLISDNWKSIFHGRGASTPDQTSAGKWWPGSKVHAAGEGSALLSPVYFSLRKSSSTWMDFYDDWSIAPDINAWHRMLSALSYRAVSSGRYSTTAITCNSPYMAAKLGLPPTSVVPNGVDSDVALLSTSQDSTRRLLLLGHFFSGRTDFALIDRVCSKDYFEHIVIGAPGKDLAMGAMVNKLRQRFGSALDIHDWLTVEDLAALSGQHTTALVPNVVNDYTLSQDLMKAYTFSALGIRVICPRLLWPNSLPKDYVYLLDHGVKLNETLQEWLDGPGPGDDWRRGIGLEHSWETRARQVARLIGEAPC